MSTKTKIVALIFALSISALSMPSFAADANGKHMPTKSLAAETPVQVKVLPLYKKDYMKSSYRDFKLKLVGPLDVTIEDYHVPQHFTNLTNFRAQRVSSPYEQGSLTEPNYYRSTIAKTGFKLKF